MSKINIMVVYSAAALFVALLIICGCGDSEEHPSDRYEPWVPLYNLKLAYCYGEPEALEDIFTSDFEYIAEEPPDGFPEDWNAGNETEVVENIANTADAVILEMGTGRKAIGKPGTGATTYTTPLLETRLRVFTNGGLCLYTRGYCRFDMVKEDATSPWRIKAWYDETSADNELIPDDETVRAMSWADIKYYFYRLEIDDKAEL